VRARREPKNKVKKKRGTFDRSHIEGSVHKGSISVYVWFSFLHHPTDLDEPNKSMTSVFLISLHRESYRPVNAAICTSAYLLYAQRFYLSPAFDRTFVQTLIAPCIVDC